MGLNSSSLTQPWAPWPGHECWALVFLPELPCCQSDSGLCLEIAAGCQVTALPLAHSLHSDEVQIACIFAWTQVWPLWGLCQPCCVDPYCWLLVHLVDNTPVCLALPGSPSQCPLSGLIESPRAFICSASFLPPDTRFFLYGACFMLLQVDQYSSGLKPQL